MKKTRNILSLLFAIVCAVALLLYVGGDFLDMDISILHDSSPNTKFTVQTIDILLSLAIVPLALYMFRIPSIHADLITHKAPALLKWGLLRLLLLGVMLISNTLLYYLFGFEPTFGYLAIITGMVMPFVVPTMKRCLAETSLEAPETDE